MRLIVLCLVLAIASPVSAETFDIAGRTVTIELPTGFCPLDRDHPMDREIFAITEDVNRTARYLFHAAPCQSLEDWHGGRALAVDRYMNAVTPLFEGEPKGLGGMTRSRFLWEMKQTLPALDLDEVQAEVDRMYSGKDIAVGGIQMLGVIAEDENALYVALASTVETAHGKNVVATLWATTALNSAIVFAYLTTDMAPGIHQTLAAELAPYMAELVRQNP